MLIQAWWRSYHTRKRIKKANIAIATFQRSFRCVINIMLSSFSDPLFLEYLLSIISCYPNKMLLAEVSVFLSLSHTLTLTHIHIYNCDVLCYIYLSSDINLLSELEDKSKKRRRRQPE